MKRPQAISPNGWFLQKGRVYHSAGYVNMSNTKIYDNLLAKTYCAIMLRKANLGWAREKNCRLKCEEGSHLIDMVFIITSCQKMLSFCVLGRRKQDKRALSGNNRILLYHQVELHSNIDWENDNKRTKWYQRLTDFLRHSINW